MILKGLPPLYKAFTVFVTQQDKPWTFLAFKTAIRNFEENERASIETMGNSFDNIMAIRGQSEDRSDKRDRIVCHGCGEEGHKSYECPDNRNDRDKNHKLNKNENCKNCKANSHNTNEAKKIDFMFSVTRPRQSKLCAFPFYFKNCI